jgi:hypothetical protein
VASPYETLSKEEANSFFFGGQPQMAPQQVAPQQTAPVETAPRKTKPIAPPAMNKPVAGALDPQGLVSQVTQANKAMQAQTPAPQAPSVVGALIDQLTENWAIPALGLGGAAALGYAGYKMASSGKEGLKSRDIMNRIDPTMDGSDLSKPTPTAVPVPKDEKQIKFAQDFEVKYGVPLATAEEISGGKITKQWEADIVGNAIKNQLPITVKKESPVIATTTTTQPVTMVTPVATTPEAPTTVTPVKPTEATTPKGPKKEPAVASFKTAKDIPEGFVFRPDVGNLDRSMYNILGPEHRQYAKELLTGGQMFGNVKDVNAEVSKLSTEYFQKLQSQIPESILSRDERRAQGVPSKFGNYGLQGFGKAAKVGGVAGTLFAVADVANAKTAEQKASAGANLLGAVLPPGTDILEASAPTLGQKQLKAFENAQKLGSPYRSVPPR